MEIKLVGNEMLVGSDALGFTHLCYAEAYSEPYSITAEKAVALKGAGVLSEDEYNAIVCQSQAAVFDTDTGGA